MNNKKDQSKIRDEVLAKIQQGVVKQKPHWQFVAQSVLVIATIMVMALIMVYLSSFMSLVSREQEFGKMARVGPEGFAVILNTLPWMIAVLLAVCFLTILFLIKKFSFAYRRPAIITATALGILTLLIAYAVNLVDPENKFARLGESRRGQGLGVIHDKYRDGKRANIILGVVVSRDAQSVTVETLRSSSTVTVLVSSSTRGTALNNEVISQPVFILTKKEGDVTSAIYMDTKPPKPPRPHKAPKR